MIRQLSKIFLYAIISVVFAQSSLAAEKLPVFVSIGPQKYFVQQIGKDLLTVQVMVQPGASPATYEPKPRQMTALAKTRVYFAIGVPFENTWLQKIAAANPKMKVVHTDLEITKIPMAAHHDHDDEVEQHAADKHDHLQEAGGLDPHVWLSPPLVKIQAYAILAALQELDPTNRDVYATNFKQFSAEIDQLDAELRQTFSGRQ
ncbi:MAG: zinc ABC transporter solute-binding protein, partial [Desulfobacterales bacterium]|nr:zinc ABC transporter solute-binding protein [Desulfobacterales bacterium]